MDILVRRAHPAEYDAVGRLTAEAYVADGHVTRGPDGYERVLLDAPRRAREAELLVAVAPETDEVIGTVTFAVHGTPYAEISRDATEAEFRMLAVSPAARGRGAGEALVRAVLDRARELGLARVVMSTKPQMVRAHRVYHRLGFTRTPDRDWSPIPGVDLVTYARDVAAEGSVSSGGDA